MFLRWWFHFTISSEMGRPMEYYSPIKGGNPPFGGQQGWISRHYVKWNKSEKDKYHVISLVCGILKCGAHRNREISGCQELGDGGNGEMLVKRYKLLIIRWKSSGNLTNLIKGWHTGCPHAGTQAAHMLAPLPRLLLPLASLCSVHHSLLAAPLQVYDSLQEFKEKKLVPATPHAQALSCEVRCFFSSRE